MRDDGVRRLAMEVLVKAGEDYLKLKESSGELFKLDGAWVDRQAEMAGIEYFLGRAGAQEYVDLAGLSLDPSAILRKL